MTVYIVDLESIPTRYTCEWKTYLPLLIKKHGHEVVVISGPNNLPNNTTPGMFLNFSATNIYKSVQVEKFSRLFSDGKIKDGDFFLFTDAWHPGVINLKYMADLLGIKIKIGGCWHAGSYDPQDGLGRLIGDAPWVRHAEKSFFDAIDFNYFATEFHIKMFMKNLFDKIVIPGATFNDKIIRSGWPMDYMSSTLDDYKSIEKKNIILFPHRIAPEKQVDIFRDLAKQLPQYEFIVCQDKELSKHEYHTLLGQSKIVFSCSLQETLGIGCYEGAIVNAIPLVPDRLSYTEMYDDVFKYPSVWTESFESYETHKHSLCNHIVRCIDNYDSLVPKINTLATQLTEKFFSANILLKNIR